MINIKKSLPREFLDFLNIKNIDPILEYFDENKFIIGVLKYNEQYNNKINLLLVDKRQFQKETKYVISMHGQKCDSMEIIKNDKETIINNNFLNINPKNNIENEIIMKFNNMENINIIIRKQIELP